MPLPTEAEHESQLTILDVGWEAGQLLATDCWLADGGPRRRPGRPGHHGDHPRDASASGSPSTCCPTTGSPSRSPSPSADPRRKKWPRGLEHAGGPAVRRALDADRCVEIPEDRELAVNGLDSRPVPAALIAAARQLLEPAHLPTDDTTA